MYAKLALSNARKSIKDYLIYFITITICVSLFYAFTSLSSSEYEFITENSYNFENLQNILKYSTYLITGILILLIGYVNKYMIRRRKREFATYILLGTEQKSVALMFFVETLIIGILSIICGIFIGTLFSQVITSIVLMTAQQEVIFTFKVYMDTVAITFIFFITMFCIIGLYNIKVLNKLKLIEMMNAHKQVEFQFKRDKKIYVVIFCIAVILYTICGYLAFKLLKSNEASFAIQNKSILSLISIGAFIIGTYALFYSIAYIMIYIKEKSINFKYEGTNLFLIGSIASKIKTAPILMATISLTFLGAAISFILTLVLSQWALGFLDYRIPFDIYIGSEYSLGFREDSSINDINDIPKLDYSEVVNYMNDNDFGVESYVQVERYFINEDDFYRRDKRDIQNIPILAIRLSDFNELRSMLGYKKIKLNESEFTTQWEQKVDQDNITKYFNENKSININGEVLNISSNPYYDESIGEGIYNFYTDKIIILPDKVCENLVLASTDFVANINSKLSHEKADDFEYKYVNNWFKENNEELLNKYSVEEDITSRFINIDIKSSETNEILNVTLAMRILGIYLGVVLLMISLTILAMGQLSDSIEHKERFSVLRRIGVEDKEINKIILKQISIYFIIPIVISIIGFIIFIYNYYVIYSLEIESYIGDTAFVFNIIISLILIISIYLCYFIATYYTFKRNIRN